jgi:hypothetical protein
MSVSKIRAALLGVLAVMLLGSLMAASASAEAGPFWHHREEGEKGSEGLKIEEASPETFTGEGTKQEFASKIGTTEILITSPSTVAEGKIFNNANQGQIVLTNKYTKPTLVKPNFPNCEVKVGTANEVVIKGHLMWKWNGTKTQLEEQPQAEQRWDIGFTAIEPPQQKPAVAEVDLTKVGSFTKITLTGGECGTLAGSFVVFGSDVGIPNHPNLKEFSRNLNVRTLSNPQTTELNQIYLQHYWDGTAFQGAKLGLVFGKEPASLVGQTETKTTKQEVAVFEK